MVLGWISDKFLILPQYTEIKGKYLVPVKGNVIPYITAGWEDYARIMRTSMLFNILAACRFEVDNIKDRYPSTTYHLRLYAKPIR